MAPTGAAAEKPAKATTKKPAAKADADEAPAKADAEGTTAKTGGQDHRQAAAKATPAKAAAPKAPKAAPAKADAATDAKPQGLAHEEGRVSDGPQESRLELKNGRDSVGQRLGVKAGDGQLVHCGLDHRPPARDDVPRRATGTGLGQ